MEGLFLRVLAVSGAVSLVLLPLMVLLPVLRRRYAPRTRWAMWLAVALVLLLAPLAPREAALVRVAVPSQGATLPATAPGKPRGAAPSEIGPEEVPAPRPAAAPTARTIPWTAILGAVWLAGCGAVLLGQGVSYGLARKRLLRHSVPVTGLEAHGEALGLKKPVEFRQVEILDTPMTIGLLRPVVLLPPQGVAPAALRHELLHIKRNDIPYQTLMLLACALHWFNPLVWLLARTAGRDVESCCDGDVVRHEDDAYRRAYGEMLLQTGAGKEMPLSTSFGGGKAQMGRRLRELFRPGKRSLPLVCLVLAAAVLAGVLVACEKKAEDDTLYTNETYGFTLQLPASWAGKFTVTEDVERQEVYFFQKNHGDNSGLLFTLRAEDAADFRAEHAGKTDAEIEDDWAVQMHILGEGGGLIFYIDFVSDVNVDLNNETIRAEYQEMDRDARSMITAQSFRYDDSRAQGAVGSPELWQGPYQAVLDSYYEAMTGEAESGLVQSMVAPYWSRGEQDDLASKLGFAHLDLNSDGIDELVLGWIGNEFWNMDEGYVFAVYTLVDGEAVLAVEGWDRCRYVVGEDGYLYQNGAGSAMETIYTKYKFSQERADFLEPVERLQSWGDVQGNEGWEYITNPEEFEAIEDAGGRGEWSIDRDEALALGEGWMASGLSIQYTPFSEYNI